MSVFVNDLEIRMLVESAKVKEENYRKCQSIYVEKSAISSQHGPVEPLIK